MGSLESLPLELLDMIRRYLDLRDTVRLGATNRYFRETAWRESKWNVDRYRERNGWVTSGARLRAVLKEADACIMGDVVFDLVRGKDRGRITSTERGEGRTLVDIVDFVTILVPAEVPFRASCPRGDVVRVAHQSTRLQRWINILIHGSINFNPRVPSLYNQSIHHTRPLMEDMEIILMDIQGFGVGLRTLPLQVLGKTPVEMGLILASQATLASQANIII